MTDAQWAVLEPVLPKGNKAGRPSKWSRRQLIDGIRWRVRVGAPWRDVPARYGPWPAVFGLFRLGRQRGLHHRAGPPACGWGAEKGTWRSSRANDPGRS